MKTRNIFMIAALFCVPVFTSCADMLDLYPEDSVSDENFWKNEQDLELFANGFYGILPGAQGPGADDQSDCYVNEKPNTWLFNQETIPTSGGAGAVVTGGISVLPIISWHAIHVYPGMRKI